MFLVNDEKHSKEHLSARTVRWSDRRVYQKWEALPPDMKVRLAVMSKEEFAKQTTSIESFDVA